MIIHTVTAENVLKYASLRLEDIPDRGLIAISGPNESGKSSIGETVCFALFGRTFSLDVDELPKAILWGETHCSAQLEFTPGDGNRYRLERFLDDAGNHSARLSLAASAATEQPLARGVEQVADKLYELIGYEFEEFVESFYLAQREITTPHPHSFAVKTMAGLVTLEYCDAACQEDREETHHEVEARKAELAALHTQIDDMAIDPSLISVLEGERNEVSRHMSESNQLIEALDAASIAYQDGLPKRESAISARGRAGFFRLLSLLLALLAGGAWYLLAKLPEHALAVRLSELLSTGLSDWQAEMIPWLAYAAGGFVLLLLLFWFRRNSLERQVLAYDESARSLATTLDNLGSLPDTEGITEIEERQIQSVPEEGGGEAGGEAEEPHASAAEPVDRAARERLSQRVSDWSATIAEVRDGVGNEQGRLERGVEHDRRRLGQLDQAIVQERERLEKATQLQAIQADLREKISEKERRMEICAVADGLIQGATREVSHQFNRKLRGLVSKTLPLFTENRYEHLQIDDDLTVRAFSSEKRDFMDLDEISSGTQRQIMLAVRLALSQELVARAVQGSQFLFLDEPFAFFDEKRTRSSLTVLPTLSEELNQIWIVAQDFADDLRFDLHVRCDRECNVIPQPQT
ncbi:MAG: AAA family ATPase [Candidatus Thiodiazotropha sp. (ex Epidulcina cf. delphinae)]|nr:AAA family ATPase [Candidatus Thiodiazotropha sp. (ex Epidulcina cf. delphinae)]